MNPMDLLVKILAPLLNPLLSRLNNWKTTVGLLCLAAVTAANNLGWLDQTWTDVAGGVASALFGIGVFHRIEKLESKK